MTVSPMATGQPHAAAPVGARGGGGRVRRRQERGGGAAAAPAAGAPPTAPASALRPVCPRFRSLPWVGIPAVGSQSPPLLPHQHGLSTNKMVLITSDYGIMSCLSIQMALITSGSVCPQLDEARAEVQQSWQARRHLGRCSPFAARIRFFSFDSSRHDCCLMARADTALEAMLATCCSHSLLLLWLVVQTLNESKKKRFEGFFLSTQTAPPLDSLKSLLAAAGGGVHRCLVRRHVLPAGLAGCRY